MMPGRQIDRQKGMIRAQDFDRLAVDVRAPSTPRRLADDDESWLLHRRVEVITELARPRRDRAAAVFAIAGRTDLRRTDRLALATYSAGSCARSACPHTRCRRSSPS